MEERAQLVGNAKIRVEFDMDAAMPVDPYTNGERLFQRLIELNPPLGRDEALSLLTQWIAQLPRAPSSQTRGHFVALPDTNDVIRRFNRDTKWLATLVVGAVVSAALMLAVLVQDRHPKAVDLTEEAVQAGGDLLLNPNPATRFTAVGLNGKSSTGKMISGQATRVDNAFTKISPQENPSSQMEAAASTPTPVLAFTPEINHVNAQTNASSWLPAHWQDPARVSRPKIRNVRYRSSVVLRSVDVKMRLIALWHQSLARSEKSWSWTAFSNLNSGVRKRAAYTAETNH